MWKWWSSFYRLYTEKFGARIHTGWLVKRVYSFAIEIIILEKNSTFDKSHGNLLCGDTMEKLILVFIVWSPMDLCRTPEDLLEKRPERSGCAVAVGETA